MSFKDKVVVVTGASSGIGAASAIEFAKHGACVVIVGRNEAKLSNVSEACRKVGSKHLIVKADMRNDEDVKLIIKKTIDQFGKLNILVNNAGMVKEGCLLKENVMPAYDQVLGTNLRGLIHLTMLAVPHLIKSKGNVVNVSSIAAIQPPLSTGFLPYCISKAGLDMFTKGAALELAPHKVRVNSVNPGPVNTDILINANIDVHTLSFDAMESYTPLQRVSQPVEIADLILFLASEKAIGITGSIFISDNGALLK